jgi:hypothetical protein
LVKFAVPLPSMSRHRPNARSVPSGATDQRWPVAVLQSQSWAALPLPLMLVSTSRHLPDTHGVVTCPTGPPRAPVLKRTWHWLPVPSQVALR